MIPTAPSFARRPLPETAMSKSARLSILVAVALLLAGASCQRPGGEPPAASEASEAAASAASEATASEAAARPPERARGALGARVGDPADWCAGHGLPESACAKCDPSRAARFRAAGDWCEEHGFPESVCPTCSPIRAPAPSGAFAPGTRIRFRTPEIERRVGV